MTLAHAIERPAFAPPFCRRPAAATELDSLGVTGTSYLYRRGEEIFGEAEPADYVYRVLSGTVRTYKILSDGRRQINEFYLPGDVFGLAAGEDHRLSAEAVSEVQVLVMKRRNLSSLATTECEVARKLWKLSLHDLHRSQAHMLLLGRRSALERLVSFLLDMAERIPAEREVVLPMSRQDIADYLGLTIETVSRTMTQLQEDGLIGLNGSRTIVLLDRESLQDIASD